MRPVQNLASGLLIVVVRSGGTIGLRHSHNFFLCQRIVFPGSSPSPYPFMLTIVQCHAGAVATK